MHACTHHAYTKVITHEFGRDRCADPATAAAGVCCSTTAGTQGLCKHALERVSYAVGAARCAAVEVGVGVVCPSSDDQYSIKQNDPLGCGYDDSGRSVKQRTRYWTSAPCRVHAQIDRKGWVSLVHEPHARSSGSSRPGELYSLSTIHIASAWLGTEAPFPPPRPTAPPLPLRLRPVSCTPTRACAT